MRRNLYKFTEIFIYSLYQTIINKGGKMESDKDNSLDEEEFDDEEELEDEGEDL
ncbi:MAG: hypothetical protein U9Q73_03055 [Nanoarchaeota archaeon]|nr:hypothetical protein [Nanoarchaeota archaeon]